MALSSTIRVRTTSRFKRRFRSVAKQQGKRPSHAAREAFEEYVVRKEKEITEPLLPALNGNGGHP